MVFSFLLPLAIPNAHSAVYISASVNVLSGMGKNHFTCIVEIRQQYCFLKEKNSEGDGGEIGGGDDKQMYKIGYDYK